MAEVKIVLLGSIGVVAETSELQRQAYNMAFARHGLDWYWTVGNYCEMLRNPGGLKRLQSYANGALSSDLLSAIHHSKAEFFKELVSDGLSFRDGVVDCLEACKAQGIKLGFITTTTAETIEILRDALSPVFDFGHFDLITTKADVAQEKPDGEVYRLAISHFGVPPHEVIAVEDTEVNQEAALKEELLCYLFAGEYATTRHNINALRSLNVIVDSLRNQQ